MNEIEKLYDNAGIEPVCDGLDCFTCTAKCNNGKYPEFTAEKELKLIKWFAHSGHFSHQTDYLPWLVDDIAWNINFLWEVLTDEEKKQIKDVLDE